MSTILGDLAIPAGEKTLTRENLDDGAMQSVPLYPYFVNERGYFGVDCPIQMVQTPSSPFVLAATDRKVFTPGRTIRPTGS